MNLPQARMISHNLRKRGSWLRCSNFSVGGVLLTLDKNQDGKLSEDELTSAPAASSGQGRRRGPGLMRMMKAHSAMDANEDGVLDATEIKNAAAALQKINANRDDQLTEDEVGMKHFGPQDTGEGGQQCRRAGEANTKAIIGWKASDAAGCRSRTRPERTYASAPAY